MSNLQNSFKYEHCHQAAAAGDIEELKRMHQSGLPLYERYGEDEEWEDEESFSIFSTTEAAVNGHLDCLRYAHENGCEWNGYETEYAAMRGHLDCLKYAYEHGCEFTDETTWRAAQHGKLDCLKYAHENGCPLIICDYIDDELVVSCRLTEVAAKWGNLDCLKYAHENGCEWDGKSTSNAAENGHLDCLRYLIENGCPYDSENKEIIEKVKQVTKDIQTTKNLIKKSAKLNDNVINHIINKYI